MRTATFAVLIVSSVALACGKAESLHGAGQGGKGSGVPAGGGKDGAGGGVGAQAGTGAELSRVELDGTPIYTRIQRLTNRQWERAVTDVLRLGQPRGLSKSFAQPSLGTSDFDNNEKILVVGLENFRDFEVGAEAAAALATNSAEAVAAMEAGSDAAAFVRTLGRRAFRRPLTAEEQTKYEAVFALGEQLYGAGFANGAALVIRALLQSPHFLYRTELGPSGEPLSGYEIASKLSFWLLGTTPSDALLDAASSGDLDRDAELEAVARDMLEDPRAIETMRDFHEQLLAVRFYEQIDKVAVPDYDPAIKGEFGPASDAFFDRVFQQSLGLGELLTSKQAYVGAGLARLYGLEPPPAGLALRELGAARAGYFMQVPFLMFGSGDEQSAPIRRALQLQKMTCAPLDDPEHLTPLPPRQPNQTNRQRISQISEQCAGSCHAVYLDPLGFALENFDGLGRERESDNGQAVDTSGSYPFAEGVATFADGKELMNIMAASMQVHTCYAKKLTSYALGRDMAELDRPLLESLGRVSQTDSLKELALALVRDPAFRTREGRLP